MRERRRLACGSRAGPGPFRVSSILQDSSDGPGLLLRDVPGLRPELAGVDAEACTGAELHGKFLQDGAGMLNFSSLDTYYGGLEAKIGAPNPKVREAMVAEQGLPAVIVNPSTPIGPRDATPMGAARLQERGEYKTSKSVKVFET